MEQHRIVFSNTDGIYVLHFNVLESKSCPKFVLLSGVWKCKNGTIMNYVLCARVLLHRVLHYFKMECEFQQRYFSVSVFHFEKNVLISINMSLDKKWPYRIAGYTKVYICVSE
jgi:hypothetical protein